MPFFYQEESLGIKVATFNTAIQHYKKRYSTNIDHNIILPDITHFQQMVWERYKAVCVESGLRAAARTTFLRYWRELAPHILVMKPMTDLCWVCQKNSTAITRAKNMLDEDKSTVSSHFLILRTCKHICNLILQATKIAEEHMHLVTKEREYYKEVCKKSATALKTYFAGPNDSLSPPQPDCHIPHLQNDITVHYSFDFAKQVSQQLNMYLRLYHHVIRCTIHVIPSSLGRCISILQGSVVSSECGAKEYHGRYVTKHT